MNLYSWDEIKRQGDCIRFVREVLGIEVGTDGRCAATWRGGTRENSVALERDKFFDFAADQGGSIIDLCAVSKFGDIAATFEAAQFLGEWLNIEPEQRAKDARRIVATYDYTDANGKLIIQVVRYEPKDFRQRRPDPEKPDGWSWSVKGIVPPLYRQPEIAGAKWICVAAGEKDVDNLRAVGIAATCNAGGEGKWLDDYNVNFTGKNVVIIADKDDTGRRHAQAVAFALRDVAKTLRVIELPDRDGPVKDASDWLAQGGTKAELGVIVKDTPRIDPKAITAPAPEPKQVSDAKKANARPFGNYDWVEGTDENGKPKPVKQPRKIADMVQDVHRRFWRFPARIGGLLFDHDRTTGRIRILRSSAALSAWIAEKSKWQLEWTRRTEGAATMEELFESIHAAADYYEMVSGVPNFPPRSDVYYTHGEMPKPDPKATAFNRLCGFFLPSTPIDAALLRVFFASPLYYRPNVHRPLWIIDSRNAQGAGKTTLCDMLAYLYGTDAVSSAIRINQHEINNPLQHDRVLRRILSETGRQIRVAVIDNVVGHFKSDQLASMLTAPTVSGMAPYGKGEERRPNDITYCITANTATIDHDLAVRAFYIHLDAPIQRDETWIQQVTTFISENRLQIMADIIGILSAPRQGNPQCVTRCPQWEYEVMLPMLETPVLHSQIWKETQSRRDSSDSTVEESETLRAHFREKLRMLGIDPDGERTCVWLPSAVLCEWSKSGIIGFGGPHGRQAPQAIRNMVKGGLMPELSDKIERFPPTGTGRSRGLMWGIDAYDAGNQPRVLTMKEGNVVEINALPF